MSFSAELRRTTAPRHEEVDAAYARFDLSRRDDYAAFLSAHAQALGAIEPVLARFGLAGRERLPGLTADLADLDAAVPEPLSFDANEPAAWGARYVVEGSRLGGAFLARSVGAGLPRRYLEAAHASGEWRAIRGELDARAEAMSDQWRRAARDGVDAAFALYRQAAGN